MSRKQAEYATGRPIHRVLVVDAVLSHICSFALSEDSAKRKTAEVT
jgi:hypothetical protein